jgi:dolichol-phosphate mannosyltransferase
MLSIVIPVHNEADNVDELYARLVAVFSQIDEPVEAIFVDDASDDATYGVLAALIDRDPRFRALRLSRNFGHQMAITAGLDAASGDAVLMMDGDLQHPPELIPEFIRLWREGYDVVYGVMEHRSEGLFKRMTAAAFYRVLARLASIDVPPAAGDFRLVGHRALVAFRAMRETNRYVRGMFSWVGFRQAPLPYVPAARHAGSPSYTLAKMVKLGADGIFSFSTRPLRLVLGTGFAVAAGSFVFGIANAVTKFTSVYVAPGWVTLVLVMTFIGGVQLFILGVTGEYIARIYDEVKHRPLYLVESQLGFGDSGLRAVDAAQSDVVSGV